MTQGRRDSPRISYDEAICLARIDGKGRVYGRGLDLSASGVSLISTDACPVGTEIKCDILLPHGPRSVTGQIVRVTEAPGGFELAVAFGEIKPAVAAVIASLIGMRAEEEARPAPQIAIDDVQHASTKRYGTPRAGDVERVPSMSRRPPINLPPPCGHQLPSVVIAAGLSRGRQEVEARPPSRRVPSTAAIARRPELAAWALRPATIATERLPTLQMAAWWSRARWIAVPVVAALTAAIVQLGFHLHFSN